MFQFPSFAPDKSGDRPAAAGLPHSDTGGSMRVCRSPPIFAACRVLPRLWEPRYPPYALILARGSRRKPLLSRFQHVNELLKLYPYGMFLVENNGFEPLTPCVQGRCSSQLS